MTGAFDACLRQVLEDEKGFVDHALDRGGPTNLGVTLKTLAAYLGRPATIEELKALTPSSVSPIYRKLYWDPHRLDDFPERLAMVVFNQVVNRRAELVIKSLQKALGVDQDGKVGARTLQAIQTTNSEAMAFDFLRESLMAYVRICQSDPSQLVFLAGWANRVMDLMARIFR